MGFGRGYFLNLEFRAESNFECAFGQEVFHDFTCHTCSIKEILDLVPIKASVLIRENVPLTVVRPASLEDVFQQVVVHSLQIWLIR